MSVGSNFVRPSHRRRAEGDGDRARQEPAGASRAPSGNGSRIRPCAMWICPATASSGWRPAGRRAIGLARTGARRRPPTERQDFRLRDLAPVCAPGPHVSRSARPSAAIPRRRVELDQVAQHRSDFAGCRARPTPNSSRAFVTGANCTTSGTPAVCSPAIQSGWLRSLPRGGPGIARRARRTQGASHRFAASRRSRPKQARPRSLRSTNQSSAATRFNRTDGGRAPISKQAIVGVVAASGNGRAVGSISRRRHRQRASHHAVSARDASSTELRSIYFSRRRLLATSPPREGQFFVLRHRHAIRGSTISRCASP